ncbi:MAG: hypothetical protein AAF211_19225, partial [Myxococcota bacterium]
MSKQATIASLIRTAAKSEAEFVEVMDQIFEDDDVERIFEFFDRLNIPRSQWRSMNRWTPPATCSSSSKLSSRVIGAPVRSGTVAS